MRGGVGKIVKCGGMTNHRSTDKRKHKLGFEQDAQSQPVFPGSASPSGFGLKPLLCRASPLFFQAIFLPEFRLASQFCEMCASSDVLTRITWNPETLSACLTMIAFCLFVCLFVCLFFCFCVAPECNKALGMQDGTIADGQISASSERRLDFGPENARLNFGGTRMRVGAWVARKRDRDQWLQVDFGNVTIVTGIDTQGRASSSCGECHDFVKNYTVSYSQENATFHQYKENGNYTKVEN